MNNEDLLKMRLQDLTSVVNVLLPVLHKTLKFVPNPDRKELLQLIEQLRGVTCFTS